MSTLSFLLFNHLMSSSWGNLLHVNDVKCDSSVSARCVVIAGHRSPSHLLLSQVVYGREKCGQTAPNSICNLREISGRTESESLQRDIKGLIHFKSGRRDKLTVPYFPWRKHTVQN